MMVGGTYNIPRVSEIAVSPHEEAHCDDLEDHFDGVNEKEDEVSLVSNGGHTLKLLVQGQKDAVREDNPQDNPVKPVVYCHNLNYLVSEWVRHRKAAQRHCRVILLLSVFCRVFKVFTWVVRERIFNRFH